MASHQTIKIKLIVPTDDARQVRRIMQNAIDDCYDVADVYVENDCENSSKTDVDLYLDTFPEGEEEEDDPGQVH